MKKTLLACVGLTFIISIILIKLYYASVVSFINETPEEEARMAELKPLEPVPVLISTGENFDQETETAEEDYEEERLDSLVIDGEKTKVKTNPSYIDCIVVGDQKIEKNMPIKFRIPENLKVKEKFIPSNTFIYAMPEINNSDINLKVNSFHTSKGFVILFMKAYKEDLYDELTENLEGEPYLLDGDTILFEY